MNLTTWKMLIVYFENSAFDAVMSWSGGVGDLAGRVGSGHRKSTRGHH